jgi:hypothetical protein
MKKKEKKKKTQVKKAIGLLLAVRGREECGGNFLWVNSVRGWGSWCIFLSPTNASL